ncbi:Tn3 family transposase [Spirosoma soli]|uniref:Tn3 family transposase n=1 Tax=Spirosoma soli TaxID=1770529 RepID=A0ABW5M6Z2_9BACT
MARRNYLSSEERTRFDSPPQLSSTERLILTDWPLWAEEYLEQIHTPTNKVGFLLQLGYFRVVTRFFVPDTYPATDVEWVARCLQLSPDLIRLKDYTHNRSLYRHRATILTHLGYQAFDEGHRRGLADEAQRLTHLQTRPALMLDALVSYLRERRVEVPVYNTLRDIVTGALQAWDAHLQAIIEAHLTPTDQALLDELLDNSGEPTRAGGGHRYPLTELKRISQSMQPKQIAERLALFRHLQALFTQLRPLILRLDLADDTIRYYAQYVLDNRSVRMAERVHERYLRLVAFIIHQYLSVGDALILTLNKAVVAVFNDCQEQLKEQYYQSRHVTASLVGQVSRRSRVHIDALTEIDQTLDIPDWTSDQKIDHIRQVLGKKQLMAEQLAADQQRVDELRAINQPVQERTDYYLALEKASHRLQLRVSGIVQALAFDADTSHPDLLAALLYYQERGGELTSPGVPVNFLDMAERQHVFTATGKLRVSLYKVLLFRAVRDGLRDGSLTVLSSYEYRSVEEYQIPLQQWQQFRAEYLHRANLTQHQNLALTLVALNERLNAQFQRTNEGLVTNPQVFFDARGGWHLHRYQAQDDEADAAVGLLYPASRVIALRDVLLQVERLTGFLSKFQHQGFVHKPGRPDTRLLLAALIGYGENIGIRKMALISKNISSHALETVATHYFSPEMTLDASDCIVAHSNALPLTDLFRRQEGLIMTGSDGQKYDVSAPSLRASASFKYFGNGEGMSVYSGLDEAGQLIYTVVINAAERESPYVLDVILHNPVIQTDAHATDMHGFSEVNFALTGLLGVEFRPRFATIHRQQLYSIDAVGTYKGKGYRIVPSARIDYENLIEQSDNLLRFLTTMRLGYTQPSTLLKRLNSYARQHPLYRALKDLGRLYKTDYILRYVDDPDLRASVEGMLTRVEHSNKFGSAVTLGNNQALGWATQRERTIAAGCKMLIMNAINYHNLLYLSEKLRQCASEADRQELLATILKSSTHTWHHINLSGEYDFSDPAQLADLFDLQALMSLPLSRAMRPPRPAK